jgi:gamma-glutamyltranspeptidase
LRELRQGGGLIRERDLASYEAGWRPPIEFSCRGHTVGLLDTSVAQKN